MINTWVWIAWLVTALIALSSTRNPLYLVLILLCLAIVNNAVSRSTHLGNDKISGARVPISPLRISVMLVVLSALFNAAISHYGETVLFLNGLVLFGIFWTFMILNQALPSRRLLRLIPRAFYPVAVVTSIAITFVPATVRNYHQIREAQSIRGHRLRGLRDWLPLIMPLMVGGLERALALAEAMTARGFASAGKLGGQFWERTLLLLGTLLVLAGWILRLTERWFLLGNTMLIAGSVLIFGTLWILGRRSPRTTYARERWSLRDVIIILGMSLVLVFILIPLPFLDRLTLPYEVYPIISLPGFDPLFGVIIVALLLPTLSIHHQSTQSHS
jgi:energy-coupling factor transport system permease protein